MAKRPVVEVECARCDRKEYREMNKTDVEDDTVAFDVALHVGEEKVEFSFSDLCTPCAGTIKGHLSQIAKKIEGVSPVRGKKGEGAKLLEEAGRKKTEERAAKVNGTGAKEKGHANA